jgi:hypothetical protein
MENTLHVGNLSYDVSAASLRQLFAEFGDVSDVDLQMDRATGRVRGRAFVTMATEAAARSALAQLNGALLDGRPLRVTVAGEEHDRHKPKELVRITTQFRERLNMAYDLDCAGVRLAIKIFPEESKSEPWRVEAFVRGVAEGESSAVTASAATRALALEDVARLWQEKSASSGAFKFDWAAIARAMAAVRAI